MLILLLENSIQTKKNALANLEKIPPNLIQNDEFIVDVPMQLDSSMSMTPTKIDLLLDYIDNLK